MRFFKVPPTIVSISTLFACVALFASCGGSPGTLRGPIAPDASGVQEKETLYVRTDAGLLKMALNGTNQKILHGARYHVKLAKDDGSFFVLSDSDTNLFLFEPGKDRDPRRIKELDGRLSAIDFSPDETKLIASRHADYNTPQAMWGETEDDTLYLIDAKTDKVRVIKPTKKGWILNLRWEKPNEVLLQRRASKGEQPQGDFGVMIDLTTEKRTPAKWANTGPRKFWKQMPFECKGARLRGSDVGITVTGWKGNAKEEKIVHLDGKERGFHDYLGAFRTLFFTPSCEHVVFGYRGSLYVVHVESKKVYFLTKGHDAWTLANDP